MTDVFGRVAEQPPLTGDGLHSKQGGNVSGGADAETVAIVLRVGEGAGVPPALDPLEPPDPPLLPVLLPPVQSRPLGARPLSTRTHESGRLANATKVPDVCHGSSLLCQSRSSIWFDACEISTSEQSGQSWSFSAALGPENWFATFAATDF
jgi:hypothetical protein